ncbi:unnamed protein product [Cuscuta europaea]|uniref:Uncharacterized protein n=1 Tax=Cuscuta europaea TaxID=41803 RepID=A0A9P0YGG4_CUSEU|nr:unnamed protein product [Cuscuta europaea]
MHNISFNLDLAPEIIGYITQLTEMDLLYQQLRTFGPISVASICNAGNFLKIAKEKGSSILIPMGRNKSSLIEFLNIFSNFVRFHDLALEDPSFLTGTMNTQRTSHPSPKHSLTWIF